jgi:hypothetical protein
MLCNVGPNDLKVRVTLGFVLLILGFITTNWWFLSGWILIGTGFLEFCPIYSLFGISTCKEKKNFWT